MKKFTILAAAFLIITMTSCSSDEGSASTTDSIIGKWNFDKISYIVDGVNVPEVDYYGNQPGCNKNYIQFNETGIANSGQHNSDCTILVQDGPWSQDGNTLNLDTESPSTPVVWEITSVTATELKLKGNLTGLEGAEPGVELFMILSLLKAE